MNFVQNLIASYVPEVAENDELEGQGMVEYALILVLVSIAAIAVLALFGPAIAAIFQQILDALSF